MVTQEQKIFLKIMEILKNFPQGIKYSNLVNLLAQEGTNRNSIDGAVYRFKQMIESGEIDNVIRPERGLYILKEYFKENLLEQKTDKFVEKLKQGNKKEQAMEENFYKPFADWLQNEQEECTRAIPLGGNKLKDKWGTPDVIGVYESKQSDIIKLPTEVISAEIKIDTNNLVTAFGQACAYKLFSNKSYIVIPKCSSQEEIGKIEALCKVFGIGLVLFDNKNPNLPGFEILVTAIKHEPDRFFINKYLKIIEDDLF